MPARATEGCRAPPPPTTRRPPASTATTRCPIALSPTTRRVPIPTTTTRTRCALTPCRTPVRAPLSMTQAPSASGWFKVTRRERTVATFEARASPPPLETRTPPPPPEPRRPPPPTLPFGLRNAATSYPHTVRRPDYFDDDIFNSEGVPMPLTRLRLGLVINSALTGRTTTWRSTRPSDLVTPSQPKQPSTRLAHDPSQEVFMADL